MVVDKSFAICFVIAFAILKIHWKSEAGVICKFKGINCESYDKTTLEFKVCRIIAVARDDNYMKVHAILKKPANSVTVSMQVYKRANGWKPFLYNNTVDACKFLKNPKANPFVYYMYSFLELYSNINHPCPYDHDIIIDKYRMLDSVLKLPFPIGIYAADTWLKINGEMLCRVNASCERTIE